MVFGPPHSVDAVQMWAGDHTTTMHTGMWSGVTHHMVEHSQHHGEHHPHHGKGPMGDRFRRERDEKRFSSRTKRVRGPGEGGLSRFRAKVLPGGTVAAHHSRDGIPPCITPKDHVGRGRRRLGAAAMDFGAEVRGKKLSVDRGGIQSLTKKPNTNAPPAFASPSVFDTIVSSPLVRDPLFFGALALLGGVVLLV